MEHYQNLSGRSFVRTYKIEPNAITVKFGDGSIYIYTDKSTSPENITEMQRLAILGQGLNTFINRVVKKGYAEKIL
ncbi:hypothetical protein BROC_00693 [Candidatus Brocadiaceae bacterium]|nr:hypothetical protein BROC_00693 [Candidatus Brocadiaceae bacterium]